MFWRRKQDDSGPKCPLCNSDVDESDAECPLCFYELDRSPRHQSLNITSGEEDTLIGLLGAENEPEVEESVLEAEDVIDLNAQDQIVQTIHDDAEFISIPADQAPSFVSSRMVPTGVSEAEDVPEPMVFEEQEEDFDLGGIDIPSPPDSSEIEYDEVPVSEGASEHPEPIAPDPEDSSEEEEEDIISDPPIPEVTQDLPPPPAPAEVTKEVATPLLPPHPPPPMPTLPPLNLPSPYLVPPPPAAAPSEHNGNLAEGPMWPWPGAEQWDTRDLRRELLDAMSAAKAGQDDKAGDILDRIGPHLGENIDLLFHVGVLLKRLGREYELVQLLMKAQARHPDNQDVRNAASRLG